MRIGFTNRIILMAVILVIGALVTMALLTGYSARSMLRDEIVKQMRSEANSFSRRVENARNQQGYIERRNLQQSIDRDRESLEAKRAMNSNCAILVEGSDTLISYYFYKPGSIPREILQDLFRLWKKGEQPSYAFSMQGEPFLAVIDPLQQIVYQDRLVNGVIITYASSAGQQSFDDWMQGALLATAAIGSGVAIALGYLAARRISGPILQLQQMAEAFGRRQFDTTTAISTGDELEALSRSLGEMGLQIKEHDLQQRTFFQNMSHELKTPLMSIQGYAEGIRDGLFPDSHDALEIIIRESMLIKKQIEDITFLLKLDLLDSFFQLEETSINELLVEAIRRIEGIALLQDIDILYQPGEDRLLRVDGEKIITVLTNILTNSLKYGRSLVEITTLIESSPVADTTEASQGLPSVQSKEGPEVSEWFVIAVRDDGKGLSDNDLQHLFDRFYKGEQPGTGLGLAIAHQITQRHQGFLQAENASEGGAVFVLKLPLLS